MSCVETVLYPTTNFVTSGTPKEPRTGFDKSSLERLEELFRKTVGNEKEIRREDFKKIVTSKNVSILLL
ncbi:hypothetical protein Bhyg_07750 [Pseudolycoriella hygida]|uniref:Uncharacterized protein n=1 Tax=Pseudolycoriella hygida TaxID=35572 RepID=A0A9Q0N3K1_9DIPT|nr:hypothetical protein Bhyg_07750 [Pseudolycoriella hygida]